MALGAGRPELGGRIIADVFSDNPWTTESTSDLVQDFGGRADEEIASRPEQLPWAALLGETERLAPFAAEVPWLLLGSNEWNLVLSALCAEATFWGSAHEAGMSKAFQIAKSEYETTAKRAVPYGLNVPMEFPWQTLETLYEASEEFVIGFELTRPALAPIPPALRNTPLLLSRLGAP